MREDTSEKPLPLEASTLRAARAFIREDYKAVIYWLRPHLGNLNALDSKKLMISIERFTEGFYPDYLRVSLERDSGDIADAIRTGRLDAEINRLKTISKDPYKRGVGVYIGVPPSSIVGGDEILDLVASSFEDENHSFPIAYCIDTEAEKTEIRLFIRDQIISVNLFDTMGGLRDCYNLYLDLWNLPNSINKS